MKRLVKNADSEAEVSNAYEYKTDLMDEFDSLLKTHKDIERFSSKYYFNILKNFINEDGMEAKFNLDNETRMKGSRNLSATAVCAYAFSVYNEMQGFSNKKDEALINGYSIENFYDYILDRLDEGLSAKPARYSDPMDEFTLLNTLSLLNKLYRKLSADARKDNNRATRTKHLVTKLINGLCYNYFFKAKPIDENRHPYIYYKFLSIFKEWVVSTDGDINIYLDVVDRGSLIELYDYIFKEAYNNGKRELYRQIAFHKSEDRSLFDVRRLIYSLLIVTMRKKFSNTLVKDEAIGIIFDEQYKTGLWSISKVVELNFVLGREDKKSGDRNDHPAETIFKIGCSPIDGNIFSYTTPISSRPIILSVECMNDMLMHDNIKEDLKLRQNEIKKTFDWMTKGLRMDDVDPKKPLGWYPEYEGRHVPQSWVAGHYLIFLRNYSDFIKAIMQDVAKKELGVTPYDELKVKSKLEDIASSYGNVQYMELFIKQKDKYYSALLYGPPGSGKSTIARAIAHKLKHDIDPDKGYDFLLITPSEFLKDSEWNIIPNINRIFKLLSVLDNTLVFFDEVDQLVELREKGSASTRWIVTALLPKLQELRDEKKVKFILATNRIEMVDHAIKRRGRIDFVLPMGSIYWKDRLKLLANTIKRLRIESEQIEDREEKQELIKTLDKFNKFIALMEKTEINKREDIKIKIIQNYLIRTDYTTSADIFYVLEKVFLNPNLFNDLFSDNNQFRVFYDLENYKFHEEESMKNIQIPLGSKPDAKKILDDNVFCPYLFRISDILNTQGLLDKMKGDGNPDVETILKDFNASARSSQEIGSETTLRLVNAVNKWLVDKSISAKTSSPIPEFEVQRQYLVQHCNKQYKDTYIMERRICI